MNRRQAKILIRTIQEDKEIVLPKTHYHIRSLTEFGYVEEVTYPVPKLDPANMTDNDKMLMKWLITGAVSTTVIDNIMHIILYKPTEKAKQWLEEKAQSRRNKDKKLLREAGYVRS